MYIGELNGHETLLLNSEKLIDFMSDKWELVESSSIQIPWNFYYI